MDAITILEIDSVELSFDERKILQSVYLKIPRYQITSILGRNGCGKSSLLQIVFGTMRATNKSVRVNGKYVESLYRQGNVARYLPQHPLTPSSMKVKDALTWYGVDLHEAKYDKLPTLISQRMGELSGGERRFIEALMVLLSPVPFVLLDEPFTNLAPIYVEALKQHIVEQKQNKGVLITDHLHREVLDIADQNYLIQSGSTYLLTNPRQELVDRGYLPG
ncbi:ABC-type lipopolysaccharide export system ATPase subunit [Runella defluvii]|uniref:ABC-type lipopolysaccharide export system ATPase subunit n=1 Tax=Runella defluvii TaxID=370973 RepID=A0A7W6EQA5_9BACT|nr:ATP-binding cassette domain-containing protein [Runella defluvii]MBB3838201.1 ABC-type lipopolysaccharide export system ATPase subunit [Runella defluvii]